MNLFLDAYGKTFEEDVLDIVLLRIEGLCKTIEREAGEGHPAFQKMIEEGHLEHYQKDLSFISNHRNDWEQFIVLLTSGEWFRLDTEELEEARKQGNIDQQLYELAWYEAHRIINRLHNNEFPLLNLVNEHKFLLEQKLK